MRVFKPPLLAALPLCLIGALSTAPAVALADYQVNEAVPGNLTIAGDSLSATREVPLLGIIGGTGETNRLIITSGGRMLTDGSGVTQPVSGTVDTEAPAVAALSDNIANPTTTSLGAFNLIWDGATWDRWTGSVTGSGEFDVTPASPSATVYLPVRCTDGTVFESCGGSGGAGGTSSNFGSAFPTPGTAIGFSDGTNMRPGLSLDADTGGGTQYVQGVNLVKRASGGSVELGTSTDPIRTDPTNATATQAAGNVAHDAADAGGPLKIGGKAVTADGTAVAAADRVDAQFDTLGVQITRAARHDRLIRGCNNATGTADTQIIAAQGAGTRIYLVGLRVNNRSATNTSVDIKSATTVIDQIPAPGSHGGAIIPYGDAPLRLGDNEALNFASVAGVTTMHVCANAYVAAN